MYILQISDLHVSDVKDLELLKEKIKYLGIRLEKCVPNGSQITCCLLGDFVEKGDPSLFPIAKEILNTLQNELCKLTARENLAIVIIPGNHDLCSDSKTEKKTLVEFNKFASAVIGGMVDFTDEKSIFESTQFGYHFISISTALHSEHKYGSIDFELLNKCSFPANTIVLTHHSLISGDNDDDAVIRNGYELQKFLEERNVVALLHGHTHGCKRYTVGRDCQVIGVGPMFKPIQDISNQCNIVHVEGNSVRRITTLMYQDDRKVWDAVDTYQKNIDNNYYGTSVYEVYSSVLRDAESGFILPNLRILIKQKLDSFEKEIFQYFETSIEEAKLWLGTECPERLEYTHGQLMTHNGITWDQHVVKTLSHNPTSKRAIVPLIDKEMAFKGGDDQLVSFDVVQFGFSNADCNDLHITVYLRALELRYFLPQNMCEVLLMAQELKKHIQSINSVTVCFFAYKAEAKEKYGCYRKSAIDMMSESQICKILFDRKYSDLYSMLNEKADMGDTVIDLGWIDKLSRALGTFYKKCNAEKVMNQIQVVHSKLCELKSLRERCSDYFQTQQQEDEFTKALRFLASMFMEDENE